MSLIMVLNMKAQIMNYGIGGKISLHLDTFDKVGKENEYEIFDLNCTMESH